MLDNKTILITGGTGSFGKEFCRIVLSEYQPKKVIVFSRDELKQYEMAKEFTQPNIRFFLGDIRDRDRLYRAFDDVDIVIHAAALKQVPAAEYNPQEFTKTNILGTENVVNAAIDRYVQNVMLISTDKSVEAETTYGASKLMAERTFVNSNVYSGSHKTKFSVVRYGNVVGSRGSVIPLFKQCVKEDRPIPITDPDMSRFFITLPQAVAFVISCLDIMQGGEVFIPKLGSITIRALAEAVAPGHPSVITGLRASEKMHEVLISSSEAINSIDCGTHFTIVSDIIKARYYVPRGVVSSHGIRYSSDTCRQLTVEEFRQLL